MEKYIADCVGDLRSMQVIQLFVLGLIAGKVFGIGMRVKRIEQALNLKKEQDGKL